MLKSVLNVKAEVNLDAALNREQLYHYAIKKSIYQYTLGEDELILTEVSAEFLLIRAVKKQLKNNGVNGNKVVHAN